MRLVGWLSASGRPENFPGCNRHVTANLGPEMHDLTRELRPRCEKSASYALKSCARGASGVDDHASYMGESFAAKHLECALAPASAKSLEEAAKALSA